MRKKVIAGNWKMNKGRSELELYFSQLNREVNGGLAAACDRLDVICATPYTLMSRAHDISSVLGVAIAAQNVHWENQGAFTGEVSVPMLLECGIHWTLVGHSERRQYFAESDLTVEKKVSIALKSGLKVIACVGETLRERESDQTGEVVARQVDAILSGAEGHSADLTLAYEPVWAIGTGLAATAAQAQEVHELIRELVGKRAGPSCASSIRILYGGSMNSANVSELLSKPDIDGGLIGGASLKPKEFATLINVALG